MVKKTDEPKRPYWFPNSLNDEVMINSLPDGSVGKALKQSYKYLRTGEEPEYTDALTNAAFQVFKARADKAIEDFAQSVEAGKAGADKRWGKRQNE